MTSALIEPPGTTADTFLGFPFVADLDNLDADIAILGIPYGMPYEASAEANDQSKAPNAIRQSPDESFIAYTRNHFDWNLGGYLLDGRDVKIVDCGNVTADQTDHKEHYRRAEQAARKTYATNTVLIPCGGSNRAPTPVMSSHAAHGAPATLLATAAHRRDAELKRAPLPQQPNQQPVQATIR